MDHDSTGRATPSPDSYEVFVDDNYHYMDEDERHRAGVHKTYGKALEHAKRRRLATRTVDGRVSVLNRRLQARSNRIHRPSRSARQGLDSLFISVHHDSTSGD